MPIEGNLDPKHISTSFAERQNLTMRMQMRRFTRLTNAFSKKFENHMHMVALYAVWYNYVKQHKSLKGLSPAMTAGISPTLWSMTDLAEMIDASLPKPGPRGPYESGWSYEKTSSGTRRPHRTGHRWSVYWFSGRSEGSRRTDGQGGRSGIRPRYPNGLGT
jgi:hypothetical protein